MAGLLRDVVEGTSVAVEAFDGTRAGPAAPEVTLVIRSPDALRRMLTAPGQLGFSRAYIAGDIDVIGDIYTVLQLQDRLKSEGESPRVSWRLDYLEPAPVGTGVST